jgi:signal transduction histidine kinase
MTSQAPSKQEVDKALLEAREVMRLLKTQSSLGPIDPDFLNTRLDKLNHSIELMAQSHQQQADAQRFTKLYDVSRAIGSSLDLQTVLSSVIDAIIVLTGAERGFLMLLNDDGVLDVRIARNFDQETVESGDFAVSRTITRQVFENGQPVLTTNASEDPLYAGQASVMIHGLRSVMATPLRARGSNIGVVYVDNRIKTGLFSQSDLELLEAFAGQAAVAIENARLFEETDDKLARRVEELQILQWIDRQLAETLDLNKAMNSTVEWASRIAQSQSTSLAMLSKDDPDFVTILAHFGEETPLLGLGKQLPRSHPLLSKVLETQQAALQSLGGDTPQTTFCVPIRREGKVVGVILVSANAENAFDYDAQTLMARMADRAAVAIENGRLYTEVQTANKAKSEFVGTVAHELKVPMTSIRGYADLILQFGQLDERSSGFVERIKGSVARMQTLVEDLSDISRIESGNLRVEMTEVDLKEVIESAKAGTIAQIEEREHQLNEDIDSDLPKVKADPARSVQILLNLLSNAYKYTPNGGHISLRVKRQADRVYLSVQDNGVGMSQEELRKLGTKFWRSDNEHTLKQSGTGLGFSITKQLIELMGGTLEIRSEKGQGSTFTVGLKVV